MANTFYCNHAHASLMSFMAQFPRFLINDSSYSGPNWTVIETYSSAASTPFEIPADTHDLDTLAADNGWRTGTLVAGDYIVVQCVGANPFQVGIEYQASNTIRFILAPYAGFNTATPDTDMTTAGNWPNPYCTNVDMTCSATLAYYSIIGESTRFILKFDAAAPSFALCYCGKLVDVHTGDTNAAVITVSPNNAYYQPGSTTFYRISPVDDTTLLAPYCGDIYLYNQGVSVGNYCYDEASGEYRLVPIWVGTPGGVHNGTYGRLDGLYVTNNNITSANKFSLGSLTYHGFSNNTSYPPLVTAWDGATAI